MSENKLRVENEEVQKGDYALDHELENVTNVVDTRDLGMIGEIIQGIIAFLNSPAFATIVQIIQQIVELIIGAFSLVSFLGYHGFQDEVVRQYISTTSFFVATTQHGSSLFSNGIHFMILILDLLSNQDLTSTEIDWKTIILQIILWIIEKLLNPDNDDGTNGRQNDKLRGSVSLMAASIKIVSIIICLRSILG